MILLLLAMTFNLNLLCFPSWVPHGVGTCIQGAWDIQRLLCQAHYSYFLSLWTLVIQDDMIGVMRSWHKGFHITIINLSRKVWKLDETYACFSSTYISIFPKCPPFIFRFSSTLYDQCRMFLLIVMHTCGLYYFLLCYTLSAIIEHPCFEYLI